MAVIEASSLPSPRGQSTVVVPEPGRGTTPGLGVARPLSEELPSLLQEDDFCVRFTQGLDEVLAPVFATIDCWDSYLDNDLTPDDFVDWLASWVGVDVDERWPLDRRRRLIDEAVGIYRVRGTAAGLAAHVALYAGATPEIVDSGGCEWSQTADTAFTGTSDASLTVRLPVDDPDSLSIGTVERIVAASRPAHVVFKVEILSAAGKVVAEATESKPAAEAGAGDGGEADDSAPGAIDLPGSEKVELAAPGPTSEDERDEDAGEGSSEGKEPSG